MRCPAFSAARPAHHHQTFRCDAPPLRGFLTGAPIGAVGGAIAGVMLIVR
jgi:hypothetical protein